MSKVTACGIVFTNGEYVLGCLPTSNDKFDLPKGKKEEGETNIDAACRECEEETGVLADKNELEDCGSFDYTNGKILRLFLHYKKNYDDLPHTKDMKCRSYFTKMRTEVPEHRAYEYIHKDEIDDKFFPRLAPIIKKVIGDV